MMIDPEKRAQLKSKERRVQVLQAADLCARVLKEHFGARGVHLFGSARGDAPWHAESDLDLAVEGLTEAELWQASGELERLVPDWLEVDLVPLERVYPEVRAHILEQASMPDNFYLALEMRLNDEIAGLERINQGLIHALERVGPAPDEFSARALATYLDDLYKGCERICERVAVALDGGAPQGDRSHYALLRQIGQAGGMDRPALFDAQLLSRLDDYRRFRHRVRHIYGYELEGGRVLELAQGASSLIREIKTAVTNFNAWLQNQAQ